jgi:hypothetical protein
VEVICIIKAAMCEGRWRGFRRVESNDWLGKIVHGFRRIQSETTVRQNMGRTLWWLVMEVMVKILGRR